MWSACNALPMSSCPRADADQAPRVAGDERAGGDDGPAGLGGGAEVPSRAHLHLPGAGLHALRLLPDRQRRRREGATPQGHHEHDGTL